VSIKKANKQMKQEHFWHQANPLKYFQVSLGGNRAVLIYEEW
jgi:hypothetical protein